MQQRWRKNNLVPRGPCSKPHQNCTKTAPKKLREGSLERQWDGRRDGDGRKGRERESEASDDEEGVEMGYGDGEQHLLRCARKLPWRKAAQQNRPDTDGGPVTSQPVIRGNFVMSTDVLTCPNHVPKFSFTFPIPPTPLPVTSQGYCKGNLVTIDFYFANTLCHCSQFLFPAWICK